MTPLVLASLLAAAPAGAPRDELRVGLAWRLWGRNLQLHGVDARYVPGLSVGTLPSGAVLDAQWFPAAHFVDDWRADFGVTLRADFAPAFTAWLGDARFDGHAARLRTGVMYRFPMRYLEPSVHLGFHTFDAGLAPGGTDAAPRPLLANVTLQGPRLGVAARLLEFWRITFDVAVGVVWVVSTGELGAPAFFPGARGAAWDANLGLAFRTWRWLDLRLGVDVTSHELELGPGARASDTFYGVSFGFVFKGS
ncbi:MAG: hypothetical protein ACOZQL_37805 [Myxococcota bacterium]